jgi:hypothetical protein
MRTVKSFGKTWAARRYTATSRSGEEIDVEMTVAGLLPAGRYELQYDMVVEGVTWFEFHGSPCPRRPLEVMS